MTNNNEIQKRQIKAQQEMLTQNQASTSKFSTMVEGISHQPVSLTPQFVRTGMIQAASKPDMSPDAVARREKQRASQQAAQIRIQTRNGSKGLKPGKHN